jgi:hypothetical protein
MPPDRRVLLCAQDGYLIADSAGQALGGATVRWVQYSNAPAQWMLSWVWITPTSRRTGLLQALWKMVVDRYPGIGPSPAMLRVHARLAPPRRGVDIPSRFDGTLLMLAWAYARKFYGFSNSERTMRFRNAKPLRTRFRGIGHLFCRHEV